MASKSRYLSSGNHDIYVRATDDAIKETKSQTHYDFYIHMNTYFPRNKGTLLESLSNCVEYGPNCVVNFQVALNFCVENI